MPRPIRVSTGIIYNVPFQSTHGAAAFLAQNLLIAACSPCLDSFVQNNHLLALNLPQGNILFSLVATPHGNILFSLVAAPHGNILFGLVVTPHRDILFGLAATPQGNILFGNAAVPHSWDI